MNRTEGRIALVVVSFPLAVLISKVGRTAVENGWLDTALGLLPLLPAVLMGVLGFEYMRRQDEMHRRILLEAAGFAFATTLAVSLGWLMVESLISLPSPAAITVIALLGGSWFIGLGLSWRRYG